MAKKKSIPAPKSDAFVRDYLAAALWTGNDDEDAPLDKNYTIDDFSDEALAKAIKDCNAFAKANAEDLAKAGDDGQNGHDFWLTRNRHGVGFWDRGYDKDVGERLTKASQAYGEKSVVVGDDGKLHIEG